MKTFKKYIQLKEADMDKLSTGHTDYHYDDGEYDWSDHKGNATSTRNMRVDRKSYDPLLDFRDLLAKIQDPKNANKIKAVLDEHPEMAEKLQAMLASGTERNQGYDYYKPANQPDTGWFDKMKNRHLNMAKNTVDSIKSANIE